MKLKDLQREILDADRLSERGRIILDLNQQVVELKARLAELEKENSELKRVKR